MTPSAMIDMRWRLPPEKVLKKSRTPPLVVSNKLARVRGSMPGSGTNESKRNTTSAPRVNHSRFLRSVALAKFARERLEAMLSAADAMGARFLGKNQRRRKARWPPAASYSDAFALVSLERRQAADQALRFLTLFFFAAA